MDNILKKIKHNGFFLLFVFLFAYAQSVQIRIWVRGELNWYTFTPEAAIAKLIAACILFFVIDFFIRKWQKSTIFSTKETLKIFSISLLVYLFLMGSIGFLIALIFDTIERNFNHKSLIISIFSNFMDGFIYGSFFLAYRYYKKDKSHQQQITIYNQTLSESNINQLKAQLNPHFLFNNLNILDQLIEEDKDKASDFLNQFSEIYRYVLQFSDKKLIPLSDEFDFAIKYFNLIRHKYGNAYLLEIEGSNTTGSIVPLTLQLLLENAVQHNLGTEKNPIRIKMSLKQNLSISNNVIPKRHSKSTSGRALNNLKEQYTILSNQQIEIQKSDDQFTVIIPVISIEV